MTISYRLLISVCLLLVFSLAPWLAAQDAGVSIVPMPLEVQVAEGEFLELPKVLHVARPEDERWASHLEIFSTHAHRVSGIQTRMEVQDSADEAQALLSIVRDPLLASDAYRLNITPEGAELRASGLKGLSHGTATLLQLFGQFPGRLPCLSVTDEPRCPYRNLMIDMGRNAHSVELLKETIDLLWFYKVDSVHLHLTDDQRFAFPSTAYPKVWDGLITREQFEDLEEYAVLRGVTIIPELEVPGHSGILRSAYPDVFGETPTELASSEQALQGIKTLLDEMMAVFSSTPYIHVGGDEAFGVPEEYQRALINKLHAYLKSKGRQTLVWEGPRPGEGGNRVNTEVIHLNWRTINYPADQMLSDGYPVVNAAWDPLYIVDHYPRINFTMTSPQHIYESLKLTQFKHVNPGIRTYANPIEVEPSAQLLGFCMPWWEGREENYFAQIVPRLIPFAEVAWSHLPERDFDAFQRRLEQVESLRVSAFYPVVLAAKDLVVESDGVFHDSTQLTLTSSLDEDDTVGSIHYTLDGRQPTPKSTIYKEPFLLDRSATLRAAYFVDGEQVGHSTKSNFVAVRPVENLALGKPVTSNVTAGPPFSVGRLTDGGTGNLDFYLGYPAEPDPVQVTIDLEEVQSISRIVVHAYTISNSYEKYRVEVSKDGRQFDEVADRMERPESSSASQTHTFPACEARFVRISSFGNKGYVFDSFSKLVEVKVFP